MISFVYHIDRAGYIQINENDCLISDYGNDLDYYKDCQELLLAITNTLNGRKISAPNLEGRYLFYILLHKPINLTDDAIGPLYKKRYLFGQDCFIDNINNYYPIVHFCKNHFLDEEVANNRYAAIMDSSIWNYFIKYDKSNGIFIDQTKLINTLTRITTNINHKIYEIVVAKEYAELNARMTRDAYLLKFPGTKSGHADNVSPFVFHSETIVEQMIENEFIRDNQTLINIKNHKWRILLVDDKANNPMAPFNEVKKDRWDNKLKIVRYWINEIFNKEDDICRKLTNFSIKERPFDAEKTMVDKDTNILIEYADTLDNARTALKKKEYDIILLDYLLLEEQNNNYINHYSYQLLEEISDKKCRNSYLVGPKGKFFFMFISAYPSAIHERLLAEGLNQSENYWYINIGACPTNTPQLFLYNLIKLMEKRLDDSGILNLSSEEIFKLVGKIYPKEDDTKGLSVRKRANENYQKVLSLQYHYRSILKDVEIPFGQNANVFNTRGSVLMTNFIQNKVNLGGLLEHLTQLVHITAFGTVRQWPEMWEEYIYFKALFEKQLDGVSINEFRQLCKNIEDYIIKLKSQQQ